MNEYLEANRTLWDAWTRINLGSRVYDVVAFASCSLLDAEAPAFRASHVVPP